MIHLKKYQQEALEKMRNGCILNGGVGSGKSLTALFYFYEKICGGKILRNGMAMANLKPLVIISTAKKRDSGEWEEECSNIALTKDKFVVDSWNNIAKYTVVKDAFFIFDEQKVGGHGAWSKAFLRIVRNNEFILLSATAGDTWLDYATIFIANGFYKNLTEFKQRHCQYSRFSKFPKVERYVEQGRLLRLRNQILIPMVFQRQTIRHVEKIKCKFDKKIQDIIIRHRWNPYTNSPFLDAGEMCRVLRQVVNSDESRIDKVKELYEQHNRLIIFYTHKYELEILKHFCRMNDVIFTEWNGQLHEDVPTGFSWIYLCQIQAACEGWNCTTTDTVVFFSQSYSYRQTVQAEGRIDRLNTPFTNLYYYHLISDSKIDQAIGQALTRKKNFNEKKFFKF